MHWALSATRVSGFRNKALITGEVLGITPQRHGNSTSRDQPTKSKGRGEAGVRKLRNHGKVVVL